MAALFVLVLAVLGAAASASTTTERPQDDVMIEQHPMQVPIAEVMPPPPPPPVQPQDTPHPIPVMVFFLPSSLHRRPEDLPVPPYRPMPVSEDSYAEAQSKYEPESYQEDSYRPQPQPDTYGYVPVAPSMEQRISPYGMQPQQPLNRDIYVNYNRPYMRYPEPPQREVPPPPPPPQEQQPIDFNSNIDEEEQQQPEANVNEVDNTEGQNRAVRQDMDEDNQDDTQDDVVPALVFFLKKKGITQDYKLFHNKDEVGIPGKANRFRRSPGGGSSFSQSSASSSSHSGDPLYFGGGGSNSFSQSSSSSSSGSGSGLGGTYGVQGGGAGYGPGGSSIGGTGYGGGDDLLNRFGATDDTKPFTVQHSGTSTGKGVHSSASSSIDNTGKVTYSVQAGRH